LESKAERKGEKGDHDRRWLVLGRGEGGQPRAKTRAERERERERERKRVRDAAN